MGTASGWVHNEYELNAGLFALSADCDAPDVKMEELLFAAPFLDGERAAANDPFRRQNEQRYSSAVQKRSASIMKDGVPQTTPSIWDLFDADAWRCPGVRPHGVDYSGTGAEGPKF